MVSKSLILGMTFALGIIIYAATMSNTNNSSENIVLIISGNVDSDCAQLNACLSPEKITTFSGNTITWKNEDISSHTISSGTPDMSTNDFDSGMLMPGYEFAHAFNNSGTYDYFCMMHPWKTGQVIVS